MTWGPLIQWDGGAPPVPVTATVRFFTLGGVGEQIAGRLTWTRGGFASDILAYQVWTEPERTQVTIYGPRKWGRSIEPGHTISVTFDLLDGDIPAGEYHGPNAKITVERL